MNINRNSWHYKLLAYSTVMANYGNKYDFINSSLDKGYSYVEVFEGGINQYYFPYWSMPNNACSYIRRAVIYPVFALLMNLILVMAILAFLFQYPLAVGATILIIISIVSFLLAAFSVIFGAGQAIKSVKEKISNSESIVGAAYNGYKQNICTVVNVKDDTND